MVVDIHPVKEGVELGLDVGEIGRATIIIGVQVDIAHTKLVVISMVNNSSINSRKKRREEEG